MALTNVQPSQRQDVRYLSSPWEPWRYVVLLAFLAVVCLSPVVLQSRTVEAPTEGSFVNQLTWLGLLIVALVTMKDGWPRVRFQLDAVIFLLAAWLLLTTWFAIVPDVSFRRYAFTMIVVFVTIVCVASPSDDNAFLRAIVTIAVFEIFLKYAFVFGMPSAGLHGTAIEPHLAGLWRGHYAHKNLAAPICVIQIFAFIAISRRISLAYLLVPILLNIVFLINAGSKTSLSLMLAAIILTHVTLRVRGLLSLMTLMAAILFVINAVTLFSMYNASIQELSRDLVGDATFTGRTDVWRFLVDYTANHPWVGAGFQSFWSVGAMSPAQQDARTWLAGAAHGHQGYLDLAATIGFPGLLLVLLFVIVRPVWDMAQVQAGRDSRFQMYVAFWLYGVLHNATESSLFDRANPVWIFMLIGICGLRRFVWRECILSVSAPTHDQVKGVRLSS